MKYNKLLILSILLFYSNCKLFPVPDNTNTWFFYLFSNTNKLPPSVVSTNPNVGEENFDINRKIFITFKDKIKTNSSEPLQIYSGKTKISGKVEVDNKTLKFTPQTNFTKNSQLEVLVEKESITDLNNAPMSSDFSFIFETGGSVDTKAPYISKLSPSDGSKNVATNRIISIQFSEPIDSGTATDSNIELYLNDVKQEIEVLYSESNLQVKPLKGLSASSLYTLKIKTGIIDSAGNALGSEYSSSFQTGAEADTVAPSLVSLIPENGKTEVSTSQKGIIAVFSEDIDVQSLNQDSFQVLDSGVSPVNGSFIYLNNIIIFYPFKSLEAGVTYTVKVGRNLQDLAANPLDKEYNYSFSTVTSETSSAAVQINTFSLTSPASNITDGSTGIAINPSIKIYFSEIPDPNTIDASTVYIKDSSDISIPLSYSYEDNNKTLVLSPSSSFSYSTTYTLGLTTQIKSIAGSKLNIATTLSFTTMADPGTNTNTTTTTYTIGGTLSGLSGILVLQNNAGDNLSLTANGSFSFGTAVNSGSNYSVTVLTQPSGQTCTVSSGTGTATANVASVSVSCGTITYTIGGTISGLTGTVVLQNNLADDKTISADGNFTFATAINSGSSYSVTVKTQPTGQICSVTGGTGTATANVASVSLSCSTPAKFTALSGVAGVSTGAYGGSIVDSSGNIYVAARTSGNLDGQIKAGTADVAIIKYNSSGVKQWTKLIGAAGGETTAYGISADSSGNIYIGGFTGVSLNGQTKTGTSDMFIIKVDSNGNAIWTKLLGTSSVTARSRGITVDSSGNVYSTGDTTGSLGGNAFIGITFDGHIEKYDTNGNLLWIRQIGVAGATTYGIKIAVDSSGNAYVGGHTTGALDGEAKIGGQDAFIIKYDTDGNKLWTRLFGGSTYNTYGYGIITDSSGDIYLSGLAAANGSPGTLPSGSLPANPTFTGGGGGPMFLAKYNSSGTFQWANARGEDGYGIGIYGVAIDSGGFIYACGSGNYRQDGLILTDTHQLYLFKYNSSGAWQWTKTISIGGGFTTRNDGGCTSNSAGDIFMTGWTSGNLDGQTKTGTEDAFITNKLY
ncbi:MAG: Ig-like domain-containing protein [Leptospiraceae bacterium]|nr:Ig-like domain-containing protein [Leptospiraceae bacterium]